MNPSSSDYRPGLPPPRFGVGSFLLAIGACCAVFAILAYVGPYFAFAVILLLLSVGAHIAGNALGTQLRANGDRPVADDSWETPLPPRRRVGPREEDYAPATRLSSDHRLGLSIYVVSLIGGVISALGGGYWIYTAIEEEATLLNMTFGMFAFAVLGAIWTFIGGSFLKVALSAWRHAQKDPREDR